MYNGGFHANEWITSKILMNFVNEISKIFIENEKIDKYNIKDIFNKVSLYIIPMLNPDTIDLLAGKYNKDSNEYINYLKISRNHPNILFPNGWKANFNGVDLNLQFPADWDKAKVIKYKKGYNKPSPRDYVGKKVLSEPESKAIYKFTIKHKFNMIICLHSQGKEIYWNYKDIKPYTGFKIGKKFEKISGYKLTTTEYQSSFAGFKDWFISKYRKPRIYN